MASICRSSCWALKPNLRTKSCGISTAMGTELKRKTMAYAAAGIMTDGYFAMRSGDTNSSAVKGVGSMRWKWK